MTLSARGALDSALHEPFDPHDEVARVEATVHLGKIFLKQRLMGITVPQKCLDLPDGIAPVHLNNGIVSEKFASFRRGISDEQAA